LGLNDIPNISQGNLKLFPNPTNEKLNLSIEFSNAVNLRAIITDISGRKIYDLNKGRIESGKHFIEIDVKDLNQGLYLVQLIDNENIISTKKFIKN
jgi:hypothetical protein